MSVKTEVNLTRTNEKEHRRELGTGINALFRGKIRSHSNFTLTANTTTTTITSTFVSENSLILTMPTTENAAAENLYFTVTQGQFIVNHANNAQTDRTYKYIVLGA